MSPSKPAASLPALASDSVLATSKRALKAVRRLGEQPSPDAAGVQKTRAALRHAKVDLDAFEPVFAPMDGGDPVVAMRRLLNRAYEDLGEFKDLDPAAPKKLQQKRWNAVAGSLAPLRKDNDEVAEALKVFRRPLEGEIAIRPDEQRSRLFWSKVPIEPDPRTPGIENVRHLVKALLGTSRRELQSLGGLSSVRSREEAERIHDVRKRLRAAMLLVSEFPELVNSSELASAKKSVTRTVARLEKIQDLAVKLRSTPKKHRDPVQRALDETAAELLSTKEVSKLVKRLATFEALLEEGAAPLPADSSLRMPD